MLDYLIQFLTNLQHSLDQMGGWALLAFAGLFVVMQIFMVPVSPMGMAAGFFFGFGRGWLALMLGCALGAALNFIISRKLARAWVHRKFGASEKFQLIDRAIGRGGWKIVALLRFVPIPFGLANYCYGLTPIRFWPYLGATCLAIIPANSLFVWMGATSHGELATLLGKGRAKSPMEYALLVVGILAAVLVLRYVAKVAKVAVERE
jgi:uncharacterized membrane protein YdjX (TVP38/TMEM64 family)